MDLGGDLPDRGRSRGLALSLSLGYLILVAVALLVTLASLESDDFDGLNNMLQIPLALPWWFVVPAPTSHVADAWLTAGLGVVNSCLIYFVVRRFQER